MTASASRWPYALLLAGTVGLVALEGFAFGLVVSWAATAAGLAAFVRARPAAAWTSLAVLLALVAAFVLSEGVKAGPLVRDAVAPSPLWAVVGSAGALAPVLAGGLFLAWTGAGARRGLAQAGLALVAAGIAGAAFATSRFAVARWTDAVALGGGALVLVALAWAVARPGAVAPPRAAEGGLNG